MNAYQITFGDVSISLILMVLAIVLSRLKRLGLERNLAIGTVRAFVQLTLIGYALRYLFKADSPWVLGGVIIVMAGVAAFETGRRLDSSIRYFRLISFGALLATLMITGSVVVLLVIRPQPWFALTVTIPLSGMILGNGLNVISQSANRFLGEMQLRRNEIEVALSLGAAPSTALYPTFKNSITSALIPAVNSLMTVGLVQLPGVMTGQILAGAPPLEAVKFQIVIMSMWVSTGLIAGLIATSLLSKLVINRRWQLRWDLTGADNSASQP
ncbi:ABC transporter permease [Candidatus Neomarinimicrobiota bacterium]